ncbi:proteasome assembly chaperone 1 [Ambystoma mexicanum]|uniref:proteasome assembly chaperone 1 n=1 Tax=Ambystoma mexicanum TaxID=8296 RepID=UPI0037E92763
MMATFFGEVLTVFSRAVDEDDEDVEEEEATDENEEDLAIRREIEKQREVHMSWNSEISTSTETTTDKLFPCSNFILAVGHNAAGFLSTYVLNSGRWEVAGSAKLWNERCTKSNPRKGPLSTSSCLFYRMGSDPTTLLCQCTCHVAEDQQFQWCEKVFSCIKKEDLKVTVLSTCSVANYKTPESTFTLPVPFLKALRTKECLQEISCCSMLEPPNIVEGLPAAVLSYCQVWQIPAVLYQCYTDAIKLDSITIEAFQPVLSSQNLCRFSKDTSNSVEMLKKIATCEEIQSNLYI